MIPLHFVAPEIQVLFSYVSAEQVTELLAGIQEQNILETGTAPELLQACRNMNWQLYSVYRQLFLVSLMSGTHSLSLNLQSKVRKLVQGKLADWQEFLLVKCLVHFSYVDQTVGQIVAPSLNIGGKDSSELETGLLARAAVQCHKDISPSDELFLLVLNSTDNFGVIRLSATGLTLDATEIRGDKLEVIEVPVLGDDSPPIGMLAGEYYRKLLRYYSKSHQTELVKCYELLSLLFGIIPPEFVIQRCYDLACKLWEPSQIPLL